jgi:hypothetical protein
MHHSIPGQSDIRVNRSNEPGPGRHRLQARQAYPPRGGGGRTRPRDCPDREEQGDGPPPCSSDGPLPCSSQSHGSVVRAPARPARGSVGSVSRRGRQRVGSRPFEPLQDFIDPPASRAGPAVDRGGGSSRGGLQRLRASAVETQATTPSRHNSLHSANHLRRRPQMVRNWTVNPEASKSRLCRGSDTRTERVINARTLSRCCTWSERREQTRKGSGEKQRCG